MWRNILSTYHSFVAYLYEIRDSAIIVYHSFPILFGNWRFNLAFIFICLPLILLLNFILALKFMKWRERRNHEEEDRKTKLKALQEEKEEIRRLCTDDLKEKSSKELSEMRSRLKGVEKNKFFVELKESISRQLNEIDLELPLVKRQERVDALAIKEEDSRELIRQIEENIKEKELELKNFEETSLRKLEAHNHAVYLEEDLTEKDKLLLLKHGYNKAYEYCVFEQDCLHVFVKPTLKHSVTHTFLVWSAMRLLKNMKGVYNVFDWDTREADVCFKYFKKDFAVEIETGTLLSKKVQLRNKIDYLQSKYKDRWIILVSKKSIASKYSKFGKVTTRVDAPKKLKKLLKSALVS